MGLRSLSVQNEKNKRCLELFRKGDEQGLAYFYRWSFHSLVFFGRELINDEFLVTCVLHECYMKAWAHRERMDSLPHIYRFIRMNLRWQLLKDIERPSYRLYRHAAMIEQYESLPAAETETPDSGEENDQYRKRKEAVDKVMDYLPEDGKMVVDLHFRSGMSLQEIARRLGTNSQHVSSQLQKSIEHLRKMVTSRHKSKHTCAPVPEAETGILTPGQAAVYRLRQERKLTFAEIASALGYSQNQVQQYYIQAYRLVRQTWKTTKPAAPVAVLNEPALQS